MIIIMKPGASKEAIHNVTCQIETRGLQVHLSEGREVTIVGVVGDKSLLNGISFEIADGVDKVVPVTESYKLANRKFHPEPSGHPDYHGRPLCSGEPGTAFRDCRCREKGRGQLPAGRRL